MSDLEHLEHIIYDALEGNAVDFQKAISDELHARCAQAVENMRPAVAAGLFGGSQEDVQEVAAPRSPSDKVATNIPVAIKDHPVATDAQFTAKNEKDKSKKASYHAGEDKVAYELAKSSGIQSPKE